MVSMVKAGHVARMCLCDQLNKRPRHEQTWGFLAPRCFACMLMVAQDLGTVHSLCVSLHLRSPDPFECIFSCYCRGLGL